MRESRTATAKILMTLRLDRVLKEQAEVQAEAENRNLNNFIETTLMERLRFKKIKHREEAAA
jgi:predicted HicB family RNase H-like nuclease